MHPGKLLDVSTSQNLFFSLGDRSELSKYLMKHVLHKNWKSRFDRIRFFPCTSVHYENKRPSDCQILCKWSLSQTVVAITKRQVRKRQLVPSPGASQKLLVHLPIYGWTVVFQGVRRCYKREIFHSWCFCCHTITVCSRDCTYLVWGVFT